MANQCINFGPAHPQDPRLMPGTSLQTRLLAHLNPFQSIPLLEDMGLGKTIQDIALIGTSKERLIANPHCSTPTIIVCPPCLITNWQSEISKHAHAGALKAKIYHGPTLHSLSKANILEYDIIITSYNTITQQFKQTNTSTSFNFKINWNCIILDEAQ
ncbi:hypothetical protein O181_072821 [Austropuccinia psidii MF-1]|uniref:Helicase ATP-binding domain-containing protein n=1 Tax=Austropuccinia psidii MF-1 TaxID=1389203 RepID=A0A9Q3F9X9_9BASI|nr:hypothetical protein [Austropuccinia psidii MF-1]